MQVILIGVGQRFAGYRPLSVLAVNALVSRLYGSAKRAHRGLLVFDFGGAFSIPDKGSRGTELLEGAYLPLRNPENTRD